MFGQLLPNKNKQVTVATVRGKFGRRQLGAQLNKAQGLFMKATVGRSGRTRFHPQGIEHHWRLHAQRKRRG